MRYVFRKWDNLTIRFVRPSCMAISWSYVRSDFCEEKRKTNAWDAVKRWCKLKCNSFSLIWYDNIEKMQNVSPLTYFTLNEEKSYSYNKKLYRKLGYGKLNMGSTLKNKLLPNIPTPKNLAKINFFTLIICSVLFNLP